MPSGAYAVDLHPEQSQFGVQVRRTVPLPPPGNSGVVDFDNVFLSLSANPPLQVQVRIFASGGGQVFLSNVPVQRSRTGIGRVIQVGDEAALLVFTPPAANQTVFAFVEYSTP
jgi:hypothetical protein